MRPVTPALVASVTWRASRPSRPPPERVQATQVSTVPKPARRARPRPVGVAGSRMAITLVAEALGATRMPSAWSSRQVPTVRRSCQPSPGHGLPGGPVPHDGRGPLVGDADASTVPPSARLAVATSSTASAMARRRTPPARGTGCRAGPGRGGRGRPWRRGGPPRPAPPRCRRRRPGRSWPGHRAEGEGQAELARVEDPRGIEGLLDRGPARRSPIRGLGQEAGPVEPDAVVVADGGAGARVARSPRPRPGGSSARARRRRPVGSGGRPAKVK
jgi:hypothetical protein